MIGSTRNLRVFAYAQPADLRKGFDGLYGIVMAELGRDPLDGDCFLFVNRARSRAKVLLWDGTGLCIYMKRLEQSRFACLWETSGSRPARERVMSEVTLFLEGSEMFNQRIRQFYSRRIGAITWGAKASGKLGSTDFSAISASSSAVPASFPSSSAICESSRWI